ncbi:ABC transporter ATP-binding protein [Lederbergia citrea]|uniref:ABC transporter ATP-binding protein n=1 Tax=Lederbergia citrea TaxID=2833581 RepID=A0A942UNJ2_9BACI|nr:ABC transporter ATP-binding protein [Lederbergia citrea]MBS4176759.1 ABC transporter ATP-binding protein [Lederbergia citrea]MBS4203320.1 ABC transporter ATP-binding protein [Lederbergia citrea]MBS4222008.1 ABC transporter ATP-binding protein [Lederbergia citrea]
MSNKQLSKTKNWRITLLKIWKYLDVYRGQLLLVLFTVLISSGLGLLGPYLIGRTVDEYIANNSGNTLGLILIIIAAAFLCFSLSSFLQNYWMIGIGQKTVFTMRTKLFHHLHQLPIKFFDKRQHGELMSRLTNDIDNVSQTLNSSIIQVFSSFLLLTGTITVMLILSPILTLITMSVIPLMYFGMKWITNRTGRLFKEQQRYLGDLNGFIQETISGQTIVKTFSQEEKMIADFMEKNERLRKAGYWAQTYSGFIPKLMNMLNNLSFAIIAGAGGILALKGHVTIGMIIVFTEYSRQFTRPLNDLANQFNTLLSAVAGAERVFEILDEDEERDIKSSMTLDRVRGEVEFRNVSFSYGDDQQTINDVNFRALPGETVALVGPTGAGKTTIINLLARFYETKSGEILIDGIDVRQIKRNNLRSKMGFVLQDSYLFQGTIRENIRYGKLEATDEEVEKAAKMANAHSFIMKLPNQYDTVLRQDGSGISQGQKQLLSIARAMLSNPSLLILDEATSNIDTITEMKIQEALYRLMKGRTSFVIAHRLNTIQKADQILVLDNGSIIEQGNHQSLLENKGFYAGLFHSQLVKESG